MSVCLLFLKGRLTVGKTRRLFTMFGGADKQMQVCEADKLWVKAGVGMERSGIT
jgi:hypothetical protein